MIDGAGMAYNGNTDVDSCVKQDAPENRMRNMIEMLQTEQLVRLQQFDAEGALGYKMLRN